MEYLIVTSGINPMESSLRDELGRRGHEVSLIDVRELSASGLNEPAQKPLSHFQRHLIRHTLGPALKQHLRKHSYQVVLSADILSAQAVTYVLQSEENMPVLTALVLSQDEILPRRVNLCCDEYITLNRHAIPTLIERGIAPERIHFMEHSNDIIRELCDVLEQLAGHWQTLIEQLQTC